MSVFEELEVAKAKNRALIREKLSTVQDATTQLYAALFETPECADRWDLLLAAERILQIAACAPCTGLDAARRARGDLEALERVARANEEHVRRGGL